MLIYAPLLFLVVTSVLQDKQKVDDVALTVKPYSFEDIEAEVTVLPRTSHFIVIYFSEQCLVKLQSIWRKCHCSAPKQMILTVCYKLNNQL